MSQNDRLQIAIVGGGIGGLSLAAALRHLGGEEKLDVHIYEAAPAFMEIGAGINFWPRAWHIMKEIGVQSKLAELLPDPPNDEMQTIFNARKADQVEGMFIDNMKMKGGAIRFHRAELLGALSGLAMGKVHLSHRFKSFEEVGNEVVLHFNNGTSATCDLLIGVDGIRSAVRRHFLAKRGSVPNEPYWSGSYAYRGLIPVDDLERVYPGHLACKEPMMYIGKFRHILTYQVSHKKLVNVVAMVSDPSREKTPVGGPTTVNVPQEEAAAIFAGCEPQVQALFKCIKKPMRFALQEIRPLDRYSMGRVILLGDAAHGMLPHQAAGAGSALEDSYILASLLTSPSSTRSTIPDIAKVYDAIRRPAANRVMELSRIAGQLRGLTAPGFEDVTEGATVEVERLRRLLHQVSKNWEWCWTESAEVEKERALEMLAFQVRRKSTTHSLSKL